MKLTPVKSAQDKRDFLLMPIELYKNDPLWVRPLDKDVEDVFDPEKNKFFTHGEVERWLLKDDGGKILGRVAAFIDRNSCDKYDQPTGGMGLFECIENQEAAFMLFDRCKEWLVERGMEAVDGPINFGEKDRWWGLLVDGFHRPLYRMSYNPPYYLKFFEAYGFKVYYEQYVFARGIPGGFKPAYAEKANRILTDPDYVIPKFSKKKMVEYAEYFRIIYNKAWTTHEAFKPMEKAQAISLMKKMKWVLDDDMIVFIFYKGEPVGFFLNIINLNELLPYMNGDLDSFWSKLKFMYHRWRRTCRTFVGIAYGVIPEHQGKGVEAAMAKHILDSVQQMDRYDHFEMGWIGDFNPKMLRVAEMINCPRYKTLYTMRKLFDETKEFKRRPIIGKK